MINVPPGTRYPGPWCQWIWTPRSTAATIIGKVVAWRLFSNEETAQRWYTGIQSPFGGVNRNVVPVGQCVTELARQPMLQVKGITDRDLIETFLLRKPPPKRTRARDPRPFEQIIKEDPALARRIIERWLLRGQSFRVRALDAPHDWTELEADAADYLVPKASRVLAGLPHVMLAHRHLTPQQHVQAATTGLWALRYAIRHGAPETLERHADHLELANLRIPYRAAPDVRAMLRGYGLDPAKHFTFPVPGNPTMLAAETYIPTMAPLVSTAAAEFLDTLPSGHQGMLLSDLWHTFAEEAFAAMNGGEQPIRYSWDPQTRVLWNLAHVDLWPAPDSAPEKLRTFLALAEHAIGPDAERTLTRPQLATLMLRAGLSPTGSTATTPP